VFLVLQRVLVVLHEHPLRRGVVASSCVRRCGRAGHARACRAPRADRLVGGAAKTSRARDHARSFGMQKKFIVNHKL
jgi:hypothetical protein